MAKKKDDNTKLFLFAGLAFLLLNKKNDNNGNGGNNGERYFLLSNGQRVRESLLPSLGYVLIQGQWYPSSALNQGATVSQNSNVNANAAQWQAWISQGVGLGTQIWDIINQINWNSNSSTGIPTNTGGGNSPWDDPFGGGGSDNPYDPNYDPYGGDV